MLFNTRACVGICISLDAPTTSIIFTTPELTVKRWTAPEVRIQDVTENCNLPEQLTFCNLFHFSEIPMSRIFSRLTDVVMSPPQQRRVNYHAGHSNARRRWYICAMAKKTTRSKKKTAKRKPIRNAVRFVLRWSVRGVCVVMLLAVALGLLWAVANPPTTFYMMQESRRLGGVDRTWVDIDDVSPVMVRAVVAAEDANFCLHWGLDVDAIRAAIEEGRGRGASTISQQVVKNVYLWHGRTWLRKALEAGMTPLVEALWSKRRILEVYLNVAEFDEGVFGVDAAAQHYFGVTPAKLSDRQAARLAAVLPNPKGRSAKNPSAGVRKRAASILDGAATIKADGRAKCFES